MTLEELMEENLKLKEDLKSLNGQVESQKLVITDYETKNLKYEEDAKKLRDLNMNLFLKVSDQQSANTVNPVVKENIEDDKNLSPVESASIVINDLISKLTK